MNLKQTLNPSLNHCDIALERPSSGWLNGFIAVVIFSGSMPATKVAVMDFNPFFLTGARGAIAGILALIALLIFKEKRPSLTQLRSLLITAFGIVLGFPLLSAFALQHISSAHSLVFLAMLPLSTAIFGVIRGGERPSKIFWFFSLMGSLLVIGYAISQGIETSPIGDILMLLAIVLCGLGYAEGAQLSKTLGGWQVISWVLVLSLPLSLSLSFFFVPTSFESIPATAWFSLFYIGLFSMFIGFIFWYRGLAQGGIAKVGQLQLLQPFFGLALSATLLQEEVSIGMLFVTVGVIICVLGSKKFAK